MQNHPILQSQTFEDASHIGARSRGWRLMGLPAELIDGGEHVAWTQETLVVRVDKMRKGRFAPCQFNELPIVGTLTARTPAAPATLQHPQAHYVLQQARCSA